MGRKGYLKEALSARTGGQDLAVYLREMYVERRFTDREIAALLDVSRSTVTKLRYDLGVDRADRQAVAL